ncbi:MAG: hypothetical protein ABH872_03790 [Candidatus Omnitrophota bacterium]
MKKVLLLIYSAIFLSFFAWPQEEFDFEPYSLDKYYEEEVERLEEDEGVEVSDDEKAALEAENQDEPVSNESSNYDPYTGQWSYENNTSSNSYNPVTGEWEESEAGKDLKYDPLTEDWSYDEPASGLRYNPYTDTWE